MKKLAIGVTICLLAVMVGTVAFAAAVRIELDAYNYSGHEGYGDGKAILNYAKGADKTEIQVNCSGLIPDEEYTVLVDHGGWTPIGTFVAKKNGKGNFHERVDGDVSDSTRVAINDSASITRLLGTP